MPLWAGFRSVWLDAKINAKGNFPKSFVRSFSSGAVLHGFGEIIFKKIYKNFIYNNFYITLFHHLKPIKRNTIWLSSTGFWFPTTWKNLWLSFTRIHTLKTFLERYVDCIMCSLAEIISNKVRKAQRFLKFTIGILRLQLRFEKICCFVSFCGIY